MMTRVAIKLRHGVKSGDREASNKEPKEVMGPDGLLSRDMGWFTLTREKHANCFSRFLFSLSLQGQEELPDFDNDLSRNTQCLSGGASFNPPLIRKNDVSRRRETG
jgi:hypothetical protein